MKLIHCVGIGPGDDGHLTREALGAITSSDVIVGYRAYLEYISHFLLDQRVISTGMTKEVDRARAAVDEALNGKRVCVVSSGDSGIYAMAGLILEVCMELGIRVERYEKKSFTPKTSNDGPLFVNIVPGVPAFVAGAALLGAPLMHDFCAISLSDLLTPWELIETRLRNAGEGDFVVALYNPRSKKRDWQLPRALDILKDYREDKTPVGIVKRASRQGESVHIFTLNTVPVETVDMESLLIIGNSNTYVYGPFMVTPRGYLEKYEIHAPSQRP